jgi:hypothetical protein
MTHPVLAGWRAGPAHQAVTDFVEGVGGRNGVPVEEQEGCGSGDRNV